MGRSLALTMLTGLLLGVVPAHAAEPMTIDLTYNSVMDMVRPEILRDIKVHHNLRIVLTGGGTVAENRDRSTKGLSDRNAMVQEMGGSEGAYAAWHVEPDGRLVRVQDDPQSTRTMTVTLAPDHSCRLDVVDTLKPGFTDYAFLRISTHSLGYFSRYHVVRTSCAVR